MRSQSALTGMGEGRDKRICLGAISGAQGIRGEVIIRSYTEDPEHIGNYGPLSDGEGGRSFEIKVLRRSKKGVIARIKGVENRNDAEALKGTELYVDGSLLPEPEADEFYHLDLIGLAAIGADGTHLGEVVSVQNFGAGDLLEIRFENAKKTGFLPFNEECVTDISVDEGRLVIVPPEGLWD